MGLLVKLGPKDYVEMLVDGKLIRIYTTRTGSTNRNNLYIEAPKEVIINRFHEKNNFMLPNKESTDGES
jgi:hypothetical protein